MLPKHLSRSKRIAGILGAAFLVTGMFTARAQGPDVTLVRQHEADRVAAVARVSPSVVAIFGAGGQGGGSGVLIDKDGYALTNFHVVSGAGITMKCGLADGVLYDAVLVGLDKVGDVALIKLLPKDGKDFPFAPLGDSDTVREGDWSMAMGNPFLLATDFTPTVTFGIVSGVHRYQYPSGTLLEYTDCIQIDTSINPGNSGGPLFNLKGELIGINGRGSFDKRGRVNSGVGYAISINQIKNFLGHLRAGLDTDHASLGATVRTEAERGGLGRVVVNSILEDSDVYRRGLDLDDEVISFDGRRILTTNQLKNVLGLYPRGWRLPMEFRVLAERDRPGDDGVRGRKEILARLMGIQRKELPEPGGPKAPPGGGKGPLPKKQQPPSGPAAKLYVAKDGFSNYYFNKLERDKLLEAFKKHGDFSGQAGTWTAEGSIRLSKSNTGSYTKVEISHGKGGGEPRVRLWMGEGKVPDELELLRSGQAEFDMKKPRDSGGLLAALYIYNRLLTKGASGFETLCDHGGHEPIYPPRPDNRPPAGGLKELRAEADVLLTRFGPYMTKWFFDQKDRHLRGLELRLSDYDDPCELYLSDYRAADERMLPHRMQVYHADKHYATFEFRDFKLTAAD